MVIIKTEYVKNVMMIVPSVLKYVTLIKLSVLQSVLNVKIRYILTKIQTV